MRTMNMLWLVAVATMLGACARVSQTVKNPDGTTLAVIEAGAGATIESNATVHLSVGDTMTVRLAGNPTTGYLWSPDFAATNMLRQVGSAAFEPDAAAKGLVGAGGVFALTFKAVAPGTVAAHIIYHRPFERDVAPVKTFTFTAAIAR